MEHKIVTIVGTRPQFIKVDKEIPQILVHSGQHYDAEMSQVFFKELKLPKPDYNLGCKSDQVGRMLDAIRKLLKKLKPKLVIVYGDCNTTLAGALAARYENIPVAHIEAGLRSGTNMPEEINRVLTDHIATYKFCPNEQSVQNLQWEGIREHVYLVGDVMFDAMNPFCPIKRTKDFQRYILLTVHRAQNMEKEALTNILQAASQLPNKVYFPIHPRTKKAIKKYNIQLGKNIKVMKPQGYKEMLTLESNALHIVTDSGGVTREAFWMQIPCTSLREETEWPETVTSGWNILAGSNINRILNAVTSRRDRPEQNVFEFGAKRKIREILSSYI